MIKSSSIHLDHDCELKSACFCKRHRYEDNSQITAVAEITYRLGPENDEQSIILTKVMGVFQSGFVAFADDRQELEAMSSKELASIGLNLLHTRFAKVIGQNGLDQWLAVCEENNCAPIGVFELADGMTRDIVYYAIVQASENARITRNPQILHSAEVFQGLGLLRPQYIAVLNEGLLVQSSSVKIYKDPKKYAEFSAELKNLNIILDERNSCGITVSRTLEIKKIPPVHMWFKTPEQRSDFMGVVQPFIQQKGLLLLTASEMQTEQLTRHTTVNFVAEDSEQMSIIDQTKGHYVLKPHRKLSNDVSTDDLV